MYVLRACGPVAMATVWKLARGATYASQSWMDRRIHSRHVPEYDRHATSLDQLAASAWGTNRATVASLLEEFRSLSEGTRFTLAGLAALRAPYALELGLAAAELEALYVVTRILRPATVVETGIANGTSSFVFLSALERNRTGRLISIDPGDRVGSLIPEGLRAQWTVVRDFAENALARWDATDAIDLFHHDSIHTYRQMRYEFECAARLGSNRLVVMCDDVGSNDAFYDFCTARGRPYALVGEGVKYEGFCKVSNQ